MLKVSAPVPTFVRPPPTPPESVPVKAVFALLPPTVRTKVLALTLPRARETAKRQVCARVQRAIGGDRDGSRAQGRTGGDDGADPLIEIAPVKVFAPLRFSVCAPEPLTRRCRR